MTDRHSYGGSTLADALECLSASQSTRRLKWKDTFTDGRASLTQEASWFGDQIFVIDPP